mgnify:FL=1
MLNVVKFILRQINAPNFLGAHIDTASSAQAWNSEDRYGICQLTLGTTGHGEEVWSGAAAGVSSEAQLDPKEVRKCFCLCRVGAAMIEVVVFVYPVPRRELGVSAVRDGEGAIVKIPDVLRWSHHDLCCVGVVVNTSHTTDIMQWLFGGISLVSSSMGYRDVPVGDADHLRELTILLVKGDQ